MKKTSANTTSFKKQSELLPFFRPCAVIILFILIAHFATAQKKGKERIDSLMQALENVKVDTVKINIWNSLSEENRYVGANDTALIQSERALALSKKIGYKRGMISSHINAGNIYQRKGNSAEALRNHHESLKLSEDIGYKKGIAASYNNIGNVYNTTSDYLNAVKNYEAALKVHAEIGNKEGEVAAYNNIGYIFESQGNYPEALKNYGIALKTSKLIGDQLRIANCYFKLGNLNSLKGNYPEALNNHLAGLKIVEKMGYLQEVAAAYSNIGFVHQKQNNHQEALKNFNASLAIFEKLENKGGMASSYINIGLLHKAKDSNQEALANFEKSIEIGKEIGNKRSLAVSYNNLGLIYNRMGRYEEALKTYETTLSINEQIGSKKGIVATYNNMGALYVQLGQISEARKLIEKALQLGKEIGARESTKNAYGNLASVDSALGNYAEAYENYKLYTIYKDSLFNEENTRKITEAQMNYVFEKQKDSITLLNERKELAYKREMELATLKHEYEKKQAVAKTKEERLLLQQEEELKRQKIEVDFSIQQAENYRKQTELLYVQDKKEAEAKLKVAREKNIRNISLAGIAAITVVGVLIYRQSRIRKRNNRELKQLNQHLDNVNHQLDIAVKDLSEANQLKSRFLGILGHDLRAPIARVVNYLNIQQQDPDALTEQEKKELDKQVIGSAKNLLNSMEDLLLWSKGQMENFRPQPKNTLVSHIFSENKRYFSDTINVSFEYKNPKNLTLVTDENYLNTIVRNLTANAVQALKYTPGGKIVWEATAKNNNIHLTITDNGPGINEKKLKNLYDDSQVMDLKSGLGLHLIRELSLAIGCKVSVLSNSAMGVSIKLQIPQA